MLQDMVDRVLETEKKAEQIREEAEREHREKVARARREANAEGKRRKLEAESRAAEELQREKVRWDAWQTERKNETGEKVRQLWEQAMERKEELAAVALKIVLEGKEE